MNFFYNRKIKNIEHEKRYHGNKCRLFYFDLFYKIAKHRPHEIGISRLSSIFICLLNSSASPDTRDAIIIENTVKFKFNVPDINKSVITEEQKNPINPDKLFSPTSFELGIVFPAKQAMVSQMIKTIIAANAISLVNKIVDIVHPTKKYVLPRSDVLSNSLVTDRKTLLNIAENLAFFTLIASINKAEIEAIKRLVTDIF